MAHVSMDTNNPLGQRPFGTMGGLGAFVGPTPTAGDFDNNKQVLNQLASMGAISSTDAANIWAGRASLEDFAVPMVMINEALMFSGQQGLPISVTNPAITDVVAHAPTSSWAGSAGSVLNAVTPSSGAGKPPTGWAALGLTGTTGIIIGAVAIGALLILTRR